MSGCNPEQSPNNKSTRDVTARRLNPYAKWVCGHSELGFACSHGPTSKGQCSNHQKTCEQQNSESEPNAESACNSCELACHQRANASGASSPWKECEAVANSPCVPVRSGWSFRNTLAINLAVGTSGLLLCMMLFPQREATFVPGSLSSKHAQILDNKLVSERCSLCHPNSHTKSELTSALATQDELCIRCHENQLPQLHLASPHDLPRAELRQISLETLFPSGLRNSNKSFDGQLVSTNLSSEESSASDLTIASISNEISAKLSSSEMETRCANCHVEHHGREHNLQAITDQRCRLATRNSSIASTMVIQTLRIFRVHSRAALLLRIKLTWRNTSLRRMRRSNAASVTSTRSSAGRSVLCFVHSALTQPALAATKKRSMQRRSTAGSCCNCPVSSPQIQSRAT